MARIIIIDDASFMRGSLKFIMEGAGHEVVAMGANGEEALELCRLHKPDLVTLDILMKGMDGLTALKNLMQEQPAPKVIMITALGQETKEEEARKLGALGYIRKPFKQQSIVEEINKVMGEKAA